MIEYSVDVLAALCKRGYTTYKLRKDKILGESTIQQLRNGELVSWASIDKICAMLGCQPGDILCHDGSQLLLQSSLVASDNIRYNLIER